MFLENFIPPYLHTVVLNALAYLIFIPFLFQLKKNYRLRDLIRLKNATIAFFKKYKWSLLSLFGIYSTISLLYPFGVDEVWAFSYFYKKPILSPFVFYDLPSNHILFSNLAVLFSVLYKSIYTWRFTSCLFLSLSVVLFYEFLKTEKSKNALIIVLIYALLPITINAGVHGKGYSLLSCIFLLQLLQPKHGKLLYFIGILVHPSFLLFGVFYALYHKKLADFKVLIGFGVSGVLFYIFMFTNNQAPFEAADTNANLLHQFLVEYSQNILLLIKTGTLLVLVFYFCFRKNSLVLLFTLFSVVAAIAFYIVFQKIIHYRMIICLPFLVSYCIGSLFNPNRFIFGLVTILGGLNFLYTENIIYRYQEHQWLRTNAQKIVNNSDFKHKTISTNQDRLGNYVEYYSVKNNIPYQWNISTEFRKSDTTFYFVK